MYKCNMCGSEVEENDLPTYTEDFGFETGIGWKSAEQSFIGNCSCGGEFEEATQCEVCYEWFCDEELENGVCNHCIENSVSIGNAIKFGNYYKETVELNGIYRSLFSDIEINKILESKLVGVTDINKKIEDFCLCDKYDFAEFLKEENK